MNLQEAEARVQLMKRDTVAARSRLAYSYSLIRFSKLLYIHKYSLISTEFSVAIELVDGMPIADSIKEYLHLAAENGGACPITLNELHPKDFLTWIATLKKSNGTSPTFSSFNTHRSALFNLYIDFGVHRSMEWEKDLNDNFKGLKRQTVAQIANGEGSIQFGKDPLQFDLLRHISVALLKSELRSDIFAKVFLIIAWNLMCRVSNTLSICYSHLDFAGDALCVYFAHQKNDQFGGHPRDPRHIYANPMYPEICPILSLGIYWLTFEFENDRNHQFPGSYQYERFRKSLSRILDLMSRDLIRRGCKSEDIGSHSIRKGVATYCSSGSTAASSTRSNSLKSWLEI